MKHEEKWMLARRRPGRGWVDLNRELARGVKLDELLNRWEATDPSGFSQAKVEVREALGKLKFHGGWALCQDSPQYPQRLRELRDAPGVLFGRGTDVLMDKGKNVAVIGTRSCSTYGRILARTIGMKLARGGYTVVNGLASGIDTEVLLGAMLERGKSIGVLGHGLERRFPPNQRVLAQEMLQNGGTLLTEFEIESPVHRWHFASRNRITVSLADTLVVVETPEKGGSMISVEIALELGVNLHVLEPPMGNKSWRGNEALISAFPETAFDSAQELLSKIERGSAAQWVNPGPSVLTGLSDALPAALAAIWLELVKADGCGLDELSQKMKQPSAKVQSQLLRLELMGWAIRAPGGRFIPVLS
jgi:DNA processing protein